MHLNRSHCAQLECPGALYNRIGIVHTTWVRIVVDNSSSHSLGLSSCYKTLTDIGMNTFFLKQNDQSCANDFANAPERMENFPGSKLTSF